MLRAQPFIEQQTSDSSSNSVFVAVLIYVNSFIIIVFYIYIVDTVSYRIPDLKHKISDYKYIKLNFVTNSEHHMY